MSTGYVSVGWNRQKKWYDRVMLAGILIYLALFLGLSMMMHPNITAETALIRGFGSGALVLLHVILAMGPLCRLDNRFLPLLYNRRHMGVAMFVMGLAHATLAVVQFHGFSDLNPIVSIFVSNANYLSLTQFPFQPLGFFALTILFVMAATSHDFWLANLTAPVWKALHMLVYVAYALLIGHVVLGMIQAESSPLIAILTALGCLIISTLHIWAGSKEKQRDQELAGNGDWVDACSVDDIKESRARVVSIGGERVAIFKYNGKLSAVSNVCKHQNGPLGEGKIIDDCITCPWHGYQYKPEDGASPPPFKERVPTFNLRLKEGRIWVDPKPNAAGTRTEPQLIETENGDQHRDDSFYVGYMPKGPKPVMKRVRSFVVGAMGTGAAVAILFSLTMNPFPAAVFEFGEVREVQGYLKEHPHPHLLVERPGEQGTWSAWYLVNQGKFGAAEAVAPFANNWVSLKGSLIYRDDQTMVELAPGGVKLLKQQPAAPINPVIAGKTQTVRGEIVDSKCFFGVMNPGDLKVHKACAIRCIQGGIPPFLVQRLDDGNVMYYLLTGKDGKSINQEVIPYVAEPLEIKGIVFKKGDMAILEINPKNIKRVGR